MPPSCARSWCRRRCGSWAAGTGGPRRSWPARTIAPRRGFRSRDLLRLSWRRRRTVQRSTRAPRSTLLGQPAQPVDRVDQAVPLGGPGDKGGQDGADGEPVRDQARPVAAIDLPVAGVLPEEAVGVAAGELPLDV